MDSLFEPDEEALKGAYAQGVRDYDKAGLGDQFVHGIVDNFNFDLGGQDKKHKAYEAGRHDREKGKVKWEKTTTSYTDREFYPGYPLFSSDTAQIIKWSFYAVFTFIILFGIYVLIYLLLLVVAIVVALSSR